jgi:hypothetical protein
MESFHMKFESRGSDIIDFPFLVESIVLLPDKNVLSVPISSAGDVEDKASFVDNSIAIKIEVLVPDVLGLLDSHVSASS